MPLVSTADGRMYSVGNGAYYMRHGNEIVKVADTPAVPASPARVESPTRGFITAHVHAPPGSVVPPSGGRTPSGAALAAGADGQSLSSRVAAKLLEGYTLLSESCPSTSVPLVQDQSGHILSVGTGRWYERTGGQLTEVGPPGAPVPGLAASTPIAAAPAPAFPRSSTSFQQNGTPLAPPPPFFPPSPAPHNGYSYGAPHSATNAVASALLSTGTSEAPPANYARPSPAAPFAHAPSPAYGRQASAASTKVPMRGVGRTCMQWPWSMYMHARERRRPSSRTCMQCVCAVRVCSACVQCVYAMRVCNECMQCMYAHIHAGGSSGGRGCPWGPAERGDVSTGEALHTHMHIHTCMHTCTYVHACAHTCVCVCVCVCVHTGGRTDQRGGGAH